MRSSPRGGGNRAIARRFTPLAMNDRSTPPPESSPAVSAFDATGARQHERIRQRAHSLWLDHGRPDGRNEEFWLEATREILEEDEDRSPTPKASELPPAIPTPRQDRTK